MNIYLDNCSFNRPFDSQIIQIINPINFIIKEVYKND